MMDRTNDNETMSSSEEAFSAILYTIQGWIYIPIFCAGIINNMLTILIIFINREMHTVTNCYLLNLAFSDILPLIVSLPFEITFLKLQPPWGELGCRLRSLLAETSTNVSILTISAFTVERYLAVCHPLRASSLSSIQRAIKIQLIMWLIAILSSIPYSYITKKNESGCRFNVEMGFYFLIPFYISTGLFFVLPVFILCFLYALMGRHLYRENSFEVTRWKKSKLRFDNDRHYSLSSEYRSEVPSGCRRHSRPRSIGSSAHVHPMKKSAFKMLFAVVITFIICYAPFHAQRLITSSFQTNQLLSVRGRTMEIFYFISGILYYLGSTINPIFYHLFSRKYRQAFRHTLKRFIPHSRQKQTDSLYSSPLASQPNFFFTNTKIVSWKHFVLYQCSSEKT